MFRGSVCLKVGTTIEERCRALRYLLQPWEIAAEARAVLQHTQQRHDTHVEGAACWMARQRIQYMGETGKDTWCSPAATLIRRVGDCDDFAVLGASLLEAIGVRQVGVVLGYGRRGIYHAWVWGVDPRGGPFQWEPQSTEICWDCTLRGYRPEYLFSRTYCGPWS